MLNIVIPMAGKGSRFQNAGYYLPKPLIPVHGKPMIEVVINNLRPSHCEYRFIFICLHEHIKNFQIDKKLKSWVPNSEVIAINKVTEGAACTVLLAKDLINSENSLMIANCDQWIDVSIDKYLTIMSSKDLDGFMMTMYATDSKWSFVRFDNQGNPCEVVEKKVVSNEATVGIYNYRRGVDFVRFAEVMIAKNIRVNNEFYVAPVYNELLREGKKIGIFNIGDLTDTMHGLGTPSDLENFLNKEFPERFCIENNLLD